MIVFKISGTRYNFPTRWDDVTYLQYISLLRTRNKLTDYIHVFTGIPIETLENAIITNLESISMALSFLTITPHFDRTKMVGPYVLPQDVTLKSVGQFEDLRALLAKLPRKQPGEVYTIEDNELIADLYLTACSIYVQKVKDGKYDYTKVEAVKEELKSASCAEVIGTGAFFLFRPMNILPPSMSRYQKFLTALKRWSQDLPGYQRTLAFFQRLFKLPPG